MANSYTWGEDSEKRTEPDGYDHLVSHDVLLRSWFQQDAECDQLRAKDPLILWMENKPLEFLTGLSLSSSLISAGKETIWESWRSFASANLSSEDSVTLLSDKRKSAFLGMNLRTYAAMRKSLWKELNFSQLMIGLSAPILDFLTSRKTPTTSDAEFLRRIFLKHLEMVEMARQQFSKKSTPRPNKFHATCNKVTCSSSLGTWLAFIGALRAFPNTKHLYPEILTDNHKKTQPRKRLWTNCRQIFVVLLYLQEHWSKHVVVLFFLDMVRLSATAKVCLKCHQAEDHPIVDFYGAELS